VFLFTICKLNAMGASHTSRFAARVRMTNSKAATGKLGGFFLFSSQVRPRIGYPTCRSRLFTENESSPNGNRGSIPIGLMPVRCGILVRFDRAKSRAAKCAVSQLVAARRPACASASSRRRRSGTKEPRPRKGCEWPGRVREEPQDFSTNALRAI